MKTKIYLKIVLIIISVLSSCKKNTKTPAPEALENEIITTVIVNLTDSSDLSKKYVLKYVDLNQNDTIKGIYTIPELEANKTYLGEIVVLDETKTPIDSTINEIIELKNEHQFQYLTNNSNLSVKYSQNDVDDNGNVLGVKPIFKTGNISNQKVNLQVELIHIPQNKTSSMLQNKANGSIDISVVFSDILIK